MTSAPGNARSTGSTATATCVVDGLTISNGPAFDEPGGPVRAHWERADDTAAAGAQLARELGATAEPYPVPDHVDTLETIAAVADQRAAAAVVVGSCGLDA